MRSLGTVSWKVSKLGTKWGRGDGLEKYEGELEDCVNFEWTLSFEMEC